MAILNTGRLVPAVPIKREENREKSYQHGNRRTYVYDCEHRKEDPAKIVKWLRKNFGERGVGWDFLLNQDCVIIEIWKPEFITMYEMWVV